jgi:hypothetical protein
VGPSVPAAAAAAASVRAVAGGMDRESGAGTMNQRLAILALVTLPLFTACKQDDAGKAGKPVEGKAAPAAPETPIELTQTVDLGAAITDPDNTSYQGLKARAPAGATTESGLTGVLIKLDDKSMEVAKAWEPGTHVAARKAKAQEKDPLDKFVAFHVDTPDAILWETRSELTGEANFLLAAEVKVGDASYKCANEGYGRFKRNEAEALLASCKSLTK